LTAYRQWAHLIPRTENERDADREGGSNAGYCHAKRYNRALDLSPGRAARSDALADDFRLLFGGDVMALVPITT